MGPLNCCCYPLSVNMAFFAAENLTVNKEIEHAPTFDSSFFMHTSAEQKKVSLFFPFGPQNCSLFDAALVQKLVLG